MLSMGKRGKMMEEGHNLRKYVDSKEIAHLLAHQSRLGHYQIESIDPDGTVHAGCHIVTWKAIERIREQLLAA